MTCRFKTQPKKITPYKRRVRNRFIHYPLTALIQPAFSPVAPFKNTVA